MFFRPNLMVTGLVTVVPSAGEIKYTAAFSGAGVPAAKQNENNELDKNRISGFNI